jgi:tRNA-2-methylthio-N6-dimethylallyladenosine synthase
VQHGADRILKRMKRLYKVADYRRMVDEARAAIPGIALASDWIVGFPGETEEEFQQSEALMKEIRFSVSYVFKYSPRPNTPATRLEDDVVDADKDRRCTHLVRTQEAISLEINQAAVGREFEVLVEGTSKRNSTRLAARTRDNRLCVFEGPLELEGKVARVRVDHASAHVLYGTLVTESAGRRLPLVP